MAEHLERGTVRVTGGTRWLDALVTDCRFAAAHFARKPVVTITMLLVLAVGMTVSTLVFSFVHAYATQPPAGVEREADLIRIRGSQAARGEQRRMRSFSEAEFLEYRKLTSQFAEVAGWLDAWGALDAGQDATTRTLEARISFVTENYFSVLGVRPVMGALPVRDDPTAGAVAVIGDAAWAKLFERRPDVIGSTLILNGAPITVVGVAPPRFTGVRAHSGAIQLWLPLATQRQVVPEHSGEYGAIARLRPGGGARAASTAVQAIAERMAESDPALRELEPSADVVPLLSRNGDPMFANDVRLLSLTVGLLGLLVLLITCTNVSAVLTGLAAARRHEIAIRLSLGAGRTRILRQLLTESVWLACIAAAAALSLVWVVLRSATRFAPDLPFEVGITASSTTFAFGVALAVGVLFGLSPALHATRLGLASVLRDSGGAIAAKRARLQRGLVVAQIAFTQPLIVMLTAVLLIIVRDIRPKSPADSADRVLLVSSTLRFAPPRNANAAASMQEILHQRRNAMYRVRDRLEATPGVEATTLLWSMRMPSGSYRVHPDDPAPGTPAQAIEFTLPSAANGYFGVMGIPIVRGREFTPSEVTREGGTAESVAILGADVARRLWGAADPIGRRLRVANDSVAGPRTLLIVGVVNDPLAEARDRGKPARIYLPPDTASAHPSLALRAAGPAQVLIPVVSRILQQEMPDVVSGARSFADIEQENARTYRIATSAVSAAGLVALLLSAIGLYAVIAFSVRQRTGEIAVRMAVGARGHQIVGQFVGDGLRLSAFGLVFGLPASLIGLRLLSTLPDFPAVALTPVTAVAALGIFLVATAAVWIPARHAASVDPAVTLRRE